MKKKLWGIIVLIALGSIAGVYLTKDSRTYNKAEKLVAEGDYAGALVYYNEAGSYPDWDTAHEKREYCGYKLAEAAVAVKDWETAIRYYECLHDSEQQRYCKQEWTKELIQPILDEYGLTDATLLHFKDDSNPTFEDNLINFDYDQYLSHADWEGMPVYHSNMFEELSDAEKLEFFKKIYEIDLINGYYTGIQTDTGTTFTATHSIAAGWNLEPLSNSRYDTEDFYEYFYKRGKSSSSSSSSGSGGGSSGTTVCSWCGGDGNTHDWGTEMHGSGHTCWKCGGDGRI